MAATAAILAFASPAHGKNELIEGSATASGAWRIAAYVNDESRRFSHCSMTALYKSGIRMAFSYASANQVFQIGWSHPSWQFTKGQSVPFSLFIDDIGPITLTALAADKEVAVVQAQSKSSLLDLLRKGSLLTVHAANNKYAFSLDGTYAALAELTNCANRYATSPPSSPSPGVASPMPSPPSMIPGAAPGPVVAGTTAEQRVEAIKIVANILAKGDMSGFRLLTAREVADLKAPHLVSTDIIWRADSVIGMLRLMPAAPGGTARSVAAAMTASDLRLCKGASASGTIRDESNPAAARFFTACEDGGVVTERRYSVIPFDSGLFYVFATVGAAHGPSRTTDVIKIDTLLRESVRDVLGK